MKIQSFIFNWNDNFDNAINLYNQCKLVSDCSIISSTCHVYNSDHIVEIGEDAYFVEQWNKALELFQPDTYDYLLHIQSDAYTNDVVRFVEKSMNIRDETNWGIYAPNVDWSAWNETHILERNYKDLLDVHMVVGTDVTCWMLHKDVLIRAPRYFDISANKYGHGVDLLYYKICRRILKRPIIKDYEFKVIHSNKTSYPTKEAIKQKNETKELYDNFITNDIKW